MYPDKIFGLFTMYGVCVGVGILCCFLFLWWSFKKAKIEESFTDFITINTVVAVVVGFGAAALFQSIYDYIANPEAGFQYGGLTFIGGLIGGAIVFRLVMQPSAMMLSSAQLANITSLRPSGATSLRAKRVTSFLRKQKHHSFIARK